MPIEFPAWIATGSTYVHQKFTLLSQEAAKTRDKVVSLAIRVFSFLASFFDSPPSDNDTNKPLAVPPPPRPVIPPGTFPWMNQEGDSRPTTPPRTDNGSNEFGSPSAEKSAQEEQVVDNQPTIDQAGMAALTASLEVIVEQPTQTPRREETPKDSPMPTPPHPTPVPIRNVTPPGIDSPPPLVSVTPTSSTPQSAPIQREELPKTFLELPIKEEEKSAISAFMKKSAEISTFMAVTLIPESNQIKTKYGHIHTLRSLAHFVTDPKTKSHLRAIMGNTLKRVGYMNDFRTRIEAHKDIQIYLPGFCVFVNANFNHVNGLLSEKKYDQFIDYLLTLE